MKKPLIILAGPTASGKTSISIDIAKAIDGEIISGDSMQVYKYMDIGTAKVTPQETEGIKHYMVDELDPKEEFNVSIFKNKCEQYIDEILSHGKTPMIVGGTGFYINSIIYELDFSNTVSNTELRDKYTKLALERGNEYLHEELAKVDPDSAKRLHVNDTKRVIRALEVYYETGKPMSESNKDFRKYNDKYNLVYFALNMDRTKLYDRINMRVDIMIKEGLVDEVKGLLDKGYDKNSVALQGIGYKEIIAYLDGEYTLDKAIEIIKRDTRRFAKRQLTWFRRENKIIWINVDEYSCKEEITKHMLELINEKLN